jgi:predicted metal-dependent hydrolase
MRKKFVNDSPFTDEQLKWLNERFEELVAQDDVDDMDIKLNNIDNRLDVIDDRLEELQTEIVDIPDEYMLKDIVNDVIDDWETERLDEAIKEILSETSLKFSIE